MSLTQAFIEYRDVTKVFQRRGKSATVVAIDKVSFDVNEGEFLVIVGPSGCGKSTLLRLCSGLTQPTGGTVVKNGQVVNKPQTDIGIVFQMPVLLQWRHVIDNILFQVEMRGLDKEKYQQKALELVELVGLKGFEDKYPKELSGGMQQRVAICRALIHDPPLLLMDEPFGALDALTRQQMNVELERIWSAQKKTVVFVTHSIQEAVLLADRIVVMTPRPGKISKIVDVKLERPRKNSIIGTEEFGSYVTAIGMSLGLTD